MAPTGILDLPVELQDQIFSYLDWDRTQHLAPNREDIFQISKTCKGLRHSIIPRLFHTVTLRLQLESADLVEPSLYKIRRHCPELAQHIRCVYVKTSFRDWSAPHNRDPRVSLFKVPGDVTDWTNPSTSFTPPQDPHRAALTAVLRQRVEDMALRICAKWLPDFENTTSTSAEALIRQTAQSIIQKQRDYNLSPDMIDTSRTQNPFSQTWRVHPLDDSSSPLAIQRKNDWSDIFSMQEVNALAVMMLCIPPTITSLVFEVCPRAQEDRQLYHFAFVLFGVIIEAFKDRIENLTLVSGHDGGQGFGAKFYQLTQAKLLTSEVVANLTAVKTLVLSASPGLKKGEPGISTSRLTTHTISRWLQVSQTVTRLEIWDATVYGRRSDNITLPGAAQTNPDVTLDNLLETIKGFTHLKHLALVNSAYMSQQRVAAANQAHDVSIIWLTVVIDLRRSFPALNLRLFGLSCQRPFKLLGPSAMRWIENAVRVNDEVDFEREDRLLEDFESFQFLWAAEDSDRGEQALENRKDGALVDAALSGRWAQKRIVSEEPDDWATI